MIQLDNGVLREVGALARCLQTINDGQFKSSGLQKGQFVFLTRICENKGLNHMELSHVLKVDKTTTTKAVQKLEKAGFVEKKRDAEDKRMWRLYPKPKAMELYPRLIAEENENIGFCFDDFSESEKAAAYHMIVRMRKNIEIKYGTIS
jgi:DNA-binding MarR family transcriptional regulator